MPTVTYLAEPLPATDEINGGELLILAIEDGFYMLVIDEEGMTAIRKPGELKLNMRFRHKDRNWIWVDVGEEMDGEED